MMGTQMIKNENVITEVVIGREYLITDNMWCKKRCRIVDYGDDLVMVEYNPFINEIELDVTKNTPTLYVVTENDYEIGILIDEIVDIELIDDNFGEAC